MVDEESGQGIPGFSALAHRLPRGIEAQIAPHPVDEGIHALEVGRNLTLRNVIGYRMDDAAELG